MSALVHQRCVIHAAREAAVRCPQCRLFYCRECVTEHEGRMMCAPCVAVLSRPVSADRSSWMSWVALALAGFVLAWVMFYYGGMGLARIPSTFFEEAK
jgi:hypothetical protein